MGRIEPAHLEQPAGELQVWLTELFDEARHWSRGRMWVPRALLMVYLVYAEVRFLRDPLRSTLFSGITLAFHEMGHLLFRFAGEFIGTLMGSGMQLLIPMAVIVIFYRQPDYFGVAVGGFWLSFSMFELANYVGDARAMNLPLVGFSDDPQHDWHYLLSTLRLLPLDTALAFVLRVSAVAIAAGSLAFAVWLLRQMQLYNRP